MNVVTFQTAKNMVMAIVGVARTAYGTYDTDPRFFEAMVDDAIINADFEFAKAVCESLSNPRRSNYMTTATPTYGAKLPVSVGPIGPVVITTTAGESRTNWKAPVVDLQRWKADSTHVLYGALDDIEGYHAIEGEVIYFIGATCTVHYVADVPRGTTSALISPAEYLNGVIAMAAGNILLKDPEFAQIANEAMSVAMAGLQNASQGLLVVPKLDLEARAA